MVIAVDFDGCIASGWPGPPYLTPGAKGALRSLKRAGHVLLLYSARANRAYLEDPMLDPLVRAGILQIRMDRWKTAVEENRRQYREMIEFVERELPGVFDAIDDGQQGKPRSADLYLDDRCLRVAVGVPSALDWFDIARMYGEPEGER